MEKNKNIKEEKWQECWKKNWTPPLEIYKTHINYFGSNIDIGCFPEFVKKKKRDSKLCEEALKIWETKFGNKISNNK